MRTGMFFLSSTLLVIPFMSGCQSSVPTTAVSSVPAVAPGESSGLASPNPPLPALQTEMSVRDIPVPVPVGWRMQSQDGGGSGSETTWTDPTDQHSWVKESDGMSLGGWFETDGVSGSISPAQMLPSNATITQLSKGLYTYVYTDSTNPYPINGVWMAGVDKDDAALGFTQLEVSLPQTSPLTNQIIQQFIPLTEEEYRKYGAVNFPPASSIASQSAPASPTGTGSASATVTTITLQVSGCDGCSVGVVRALSSPSQAKPPTPDFWTGPTGEVVNGIVTIQVPTAYTQGLSFSVAAPWEGNTGAQTNIVLGDSSAGGATVGPSEAKSRKEATACWAGTSAAEVVIPITVVKTILSGIGGPATAALAWASPTVPTIGPLNQTVKGTLGNQDAYYC